MKVSSIEYQVIRCWTLEFQSAIEDLEAGRLQQKLGNPVPAALCSALNLGIPKCYWGFGGRLFAAETREPHSSSSLLVSSLWTIISMKHKESLCTPVAVAIASASCSSVRTCYLHIPSNEKWILLEYTQMASSLWQLNG